MVLLCTAAIAKLQLSFQERAEFLLLLAGSAGVGQATKTKGSLATTLHMLEQQALEALQDPSSVRHLMCSCVVMFCRK